MRSREQISGASRAGDTRVQWVKCSRRQVDRTKQGVLFYIRGGPRRGGPPTLRSATGPSRFLSAAEISDLSGSIRPPTGYLLFVIYMTRYAPR